MFIDDTVTFSSIDKKITSRVVVRVCRRAHIGEFLSRVTFSLLNDSDRNLASVIIRLRSLDGARQFYAYILRVAENN